MKLRLVTISFKKCPHVRLRVRLEQFKQLYVAHVLNHLLCRCTERVVGFVLM